MVKSSTNDESNASVDVRLCRMLGIAVCLVRNIAHAAFASLPCHQERSRMAGSANCRNTPGQLSCTQFTSPPPVISWARRPRSRSATRKDIVDGCYSYSRKVHERRDKPARSVHATRAMHRRHHQLQRWTNRGTTNQIQTPKQQSGIQLARPSICLMTCFKRQ